MGSQCWACGDINLHETELEQLRERLKMEKENEMNTLRIEYGKQIIAMYA